MTTTTATNTRTDHAATLIRCTIWNLRQNQDDRLDTDDRFDRQTLACYAGAKVKVMAPDLLIVTLEGEDTDGAFATTGPEALTQIVDMAFDRTDQFPDATIHQAGFNSPLGHRVAVVTLA